jgi:putative addiction module component (TIGR02574 family)
MTVSVDELAIKAMELSGESRALLAEKLVESLDHESINKIWLAEVKKRRDEVRNNQVKPIPGTEVMEDVRKLINK